MNILINRDFHEPGFCLDGESTLHVVTTDGRKRAWSIASVEADTIPADMEGGDGRAHVVTTPDGWWLLVRSYNTDTVHAFRSRADLGRFLWQSVCEDATSLLVLLQLGMLHFDPNGHDRGEPKDSSVSEDTVTSVRAD